MSPFTLRRFAADSYERRIENAIVPRSERYDLDGETQLYVRDGQIETVHANAVTDEVP